VRATCDSAYQDGTKVTLLEMDFPELLSSDTLLQQSAAINGQNLDEAKELLKGLKGFKINLDPEVSIEFSNYGCSVRDPVSGRASNTRGLLRKRKGRHLCSHKTVVGFDRHSRARFENFTTEVAKRNGDFQAG